MYLRSGRALILPVAFAAIATLSALGESPRPVLRSSVPVDDAWSSPQILKNASAKPGIVELDLTAAPTRLELAPGKPTEAWAFNGMVPGPTIELHEGDQVTVHFHNKLAQ